MLGLGDLSGLSNINDSVILWSCSMLWKVLCVLALCFICSFCNLFFHLKQLNLTFIFFILSCLPRSFPKKSALITCAPCSEGCVLVHLCYLWVRAAASYRSYSSGLPKQPAARTHHRVYTAKPSCTLCVF